MEISDFKETEQRAAALKRGATFKPNEKRALMSELKLRPPKNQGVFEGDTESFGPRAGPTGCTILRPPNSKGNSGLHPKGTLQMKTNYRSTFAALLVGLLVACLASPLMVRADEGMWTFDNFPSKTVAAKYGFAPSQTWLDHVRASSLRIAGGCSASFISPQGLVMTNHHCVLDCVQELSTAQQNFVETGFAAQTLADERKCPAFELDQLTQITDVTADVLQAMAGKTGSAANAALHAKDAELQQSCGSDPAVLCQVVSLYEGGVYDLYRYKRYNDVRLVFAPEMGVAQFGGDPDNFNFPRFDFDIGVVRAYENDHPASSPDYLKWSSNGSKDGDLVFVSGDPGGTSRELTVSQLAFDRDTLYPSAMPDIAEVRGLMEQFATQGPEQAREADEPYSSSRTRSRRTSAAKGR